MCFALVSTALLPVVFLSAISSASDAHPRKLRDTLSDLGHPFAHRVAKWSGRLRRIATQ
jgi:hypothetical protein